MSQQNNCANIKPRKHSVPVISCNCGASYPCLPKANYDALESVNQKRYDDLHKSHEKHTIIEIRTMEQYVCNCGFATSSLPTFNGHVQLQHKLENYKSGFFKKVMGHKVKCSLCDNHFYFSCEENFCESFKRKHPMCHRQGAKMSFVNMNIEVYQPIANKVDDVTKEEKCFPLEGLDGMIWHLANRVACW